MTLNDLKQCNDRLPRAISAVAELLVSLWLINWIIISHEFTKIAV